MCIVPPPISILQLASGHTKMPQATKSHPPLQASQRPHSDPDVSGLDSIPTR